MSFNIAVSNGPGRTMILKSSLETKDIIHLYSVTTLFYSGLWWIFRISQQHWACGMMIHRRLDASTLKDLIYMFN